MFVEIYDRTVELNPVTSFIQLSSHSDFYFEELTSHRAVDFGFHHLIGQLSKDVPFWRIIATHIAGGNKGWVVDKACHDKLRHQLRNRDSDIVEKMLKEEAATAKEYARADL